MPVLSLVVATRGRATPFADLFASLAAQTFRDFEVIVVDQNADERVGDLAAAAPFPLLHLRTPTETGLSRARNRGLRHARGEVVLFPDDDCWYPPRAFEDALARMGRLGADVLAGRAADEMGRDINGRYERTATRITRANVFTTGIEWVVFFRRAVLEAVGGYDTDIGVGAATPWQACEGQDIMLRALARGYVCVFDPAVVGHHAELDIASPAMLSKGRAYARGLGYVLRRHGFPARTIVAWVVRPVARAAIALARGDRTRAAYYRNVALGRIEGWRMRVGTTPVPQLAAAPPPREAAVVPATREPEPV